MILTFYSSHPQTQNLSISKTQILEPQTKIEQGRSIGGGVTGNRQKLNKSMSESHIDTSRIRHKYPRPSELLENSTIRERIGNNELDSDAKNGCALM